MLIVFGFIALFWVAWAGVVLILLGIHGLIYYLHSNDPDKLISISGARFQSTVDYSIRHHETITVVIIAAAVSWLLASEWLPLGVENSLILNFLFIIFIIALVLGAFKLFIKFYPKILHWCLDNKKTFFGYSCNYNSHWFQYLDRFR